MRLKAIKLSGFKSFVDPTRVSFPSNMCAVVGPNGCGKSNIIDAVRWVMGESSAKNLRGQSMTDVIFNGSRGRGPVGQASVELIFDNSDHSLTGTYAAYGEISVKRKVSRDGKNSYFLNGTLCRRRDIQDIFLGTGLGPRSYAIISQGIVSNLIESKPDELRVFIEEAAGISRYKERRRETGNRIRRTQENLERLGDLREELDRQLQRLARQARAAEQYQAYRAEERQKKVELMALRWRSVNEDRGQREQRILQTELQHERVLSEQRSAEARIETLRETQVTGGEQLQQVQEHYYSLGGEIARLEQNIAHRRERGSQLKSDLEALAQRLSETAVLLETDHEQLALLDEELLELEPELELCLERVESEAERLADAEEQMQAWQERWEAFNRQQAEPERAADVARTHIEQLEQQLLRLESRQQRLQLEQQGLGSDEDAEQLALLAEERAECALEIEALLEEQRTLEEALDALQARDGALREETRQAQDQLSELKGRRASLQALQEAARAQALDHDQWLAERGLAEQPRLMEQIAVAPGWEAAVEQVLGPALQALCLDQLDVLTEPPHGDWPAGLRAFDRVSVSDTSECISSVITLADRVEAPVALQGVLASVQLADSRQEALTRRAALKAWESVITPCGCWLGPNWLVLAANDEEAGGLLARQQQLQLIEEQIEVQETISAELHRRRLALNGEEQQLRASLRDQAAALEGMRQRHQQLELQLGAGRARLEQQQGRRAQLMLELGELGEQAQELREERAEAQLRLADAIEAMQVSGERREALLAERDTCRAGLDQLRQQSRQQRDLRHQLELRQQTLSTQRQSLLQGVERLSSQSRQLHEQEAQVRAQLSSADEPDEELELELEALLEERLQAEEALQHARATQAETERALREAEQQRGQAAAQVELLRGQLERERLDHQGAQVFLQSLEAQVDEASFDLDTVLANLPSDALSSDWEEALAALAGRIQQLGAINLAAIEEYELQQQRKRYLDQQNDDLMQALETLESAIRRIDRETRARFKTTFDKVNQGLQQLFPRVFGGGRAYLELIGDDLLDTGVAIMAQPPGKKNSTIHLLSGGEKALTAIALVFAIFQLNPAPFCLLDEVDAPLDDANVGRYAKMVKEMSEQVQFIYITHNKIAMEAANQLIGVTMQEPGVSRPVSVDIEEAAELAQS